MARSRDGQPPGDGTAAADARRSDAAEVRGAEALDMLKAWNTGHPGGIATVHANSAHSALFRLEQLIQEAVPTVPRQLIAQAIDIVVFIAGRGGARRVETVAIVDGFAAGDYRLRDLSSPQPPTLSLAKEGI